MSDQARKVLAPVAEVLLDTPTYLEVPDFQRVAIIGDYASGVLYLSYVAYVSLLSRLDLLRSNPLCKRDLVQQDGPAHKLIHNTLLHLHYIIYTASSLSSSNSSKCLVALGVNLTQGHWVIDLL